MKPSSSIQEGGCTTPPRLRVPRLDGAKSMAGLAKFVFLVMAVMVIGPLAYVGAVFGASGGVMAVQALSNPNRETAGVVLGGIFGVSLALLGGSFVASRLSRTLAVRLHRPDPNEAHNRRA